MQDPLAYLGISYGAILSLELFYLLMKFKSFFSSIDDSYNYIISILSFFTSKFSCNTLVSQIYDPLFFIIYSFICVYKYGTKILPVESIYVAHTYMYL